MRPSNPTAFSKADSNLGVSTQPLALPDKPARTSTCEQHHQGNSALHWKRAAHLERCINLGKPWSTPEEYAQSSFLNVMSRPSSGNASRTDEEESEYH